jgi:hypothetical protein
MESENTSLEYVWMGVGGVARVFTDGNSSRKRREKLFSYLRLVSSLSPPSPSIFLLAFKTTRNSCGARRRHVTARSKVNNVICSENMMEKAFYIASLLVNLKRSLENHFK